MLRPRFIELHEQTWFPEFLRGAVTDVLQFALNRLHYFELIAPLLRAAIQRTGTFRVVDLCSGSGGPWLELLRSLRTQQPLSVYLTDKFPTGAPFDRLELASGHAIAYCAQPVDAENVPDTLPGFRTLFNSFHHFEPARAVRVLTDAVKRGEGLAIFEVPQRNFLTICSTCFMAIGAFLFLPFIRPFSLSLFFFTYIIPVLPFVMLFDGVVSCLRSYSPSELRHLAAMASVQPYSWTAGTIRHEIPAVAVTYLVGCPTQSA